MKTPQAAPLLAHVAPATQRYILYAALLATLALLLAHAGVYAFCTDDAFISYRYARNLSEGHGLVFNPGFERVEGYTNFLWILILAGFNTVGAAPETIAPVFTIALTIVLWLLVVWFTCRNSRDSNRAWLVVVPALYLAATRSVAVWSTSGLETRLFEVLVVAGAFRLIVEVQAQLSGGGRRRPLAVVLFALSTLTRPDGLLVSLSAFAVAGVHLQRRGRSALGRFAGQLGVYALFVVCHCAFRLAYYGEWLANTYYAKVDGNTWWDMGFAYLGTFALEYAAYLWLPLLGAAVHYHHTRKTLYIPAVYAAVIVPHALYVASIGGDHFEYRPLDLYFPFIFLLLFDGARHLLRRAMSVIGIVFYLGAVLTGLILLPYQSHSQFPDRYIVGFPGKAQDTPAAEVFMQPGRDPIYRLPGFRYVAEAHRKLLHSLTGSFVGIRQEEHRLFLEKVISDGLRLRQLIDDGRMPADFHIAIRNVGAIPYYSDIRTLDRTGLTDTHVARSEFVDRRGLMAHGKSATFEYAREAGVDFWSLAVQTCLDVADPRFVSVFPDADAVAHVGDRHFLLGRLPQGFAATAKRFPKLQLKPTSPSTMYQIAQSLCEESRPEAAARLFATAVRLLPEGQQSRAIVQADYAACLIGLRRQKEAEPELLAAYATMQRSVGQSHSATQRILADLVGLYEFLGRLDEAEAYRELLIPPDEPNERE
ncbi:MAG: tetratricopeptide repeat protein [Planctomycetota bacterium]|jgi:hypothetical protein